MGKKGDLSDSERGMIVGARDYRFPSRPKWRGFCEQNHQDLTVDMTGPAIWIMGLQCIILQW